ncbi:hypothetical protein [Paenibacillus sabinae]|uniref:Uncharacterized protein n=1 Tax=Paenibacillus sabinae T27 TaxID=1268072 RepID=X4ZWS5_9BACL|nr:hypothetical protein [Paenibacillus sabinae]AHV96159.1 hypothetical protein PSAB_06115 [Paenibacillus sabinae T27]
MATAAKPIPTGTVKNAASPKTTAPVYTPTAQPKTAAASTSGAAVSAPKASSPVSTPAVKAPTAAPAAVSPQIQAEIQRKAAAGIPLTNQSNAANVAAYKAAQPAAVKPSAAPATAATTNYGGTGNPLNELLYLKKSYESGKTGSAAYAGQYYGKLDNGTAAAVKNMNAAQLEQYINGQRQNTPTAATPTAAAPNMDMNIPQAPAPKDYRSLAQAAYDQQLASLLAGAQSQETELNRRYDYAAGVTRDNRTLRDASIARNEAPTAWDGSAGYRGAQRDRTDSTEDHYTREGLNDAVSAAYAQTNAFRDQSGNFIATKANELQSADQQLAMQEAGITGMYNGQQTLAARTSDRQLGMQEGQLTGYYNGQATADERQNQIANARNNRIDNLDAAKVYMDATGRVVTPQADWGGYIRQAQNPNAPLTSAQQNISFNQNMQNRQQNFTEGQQQWQNSFDLTKFNEDVRQYGLDYALQQQQVAISQQNANTSYMSAANSNNNNNFNKLMDIWKATGTAPSGLEGYGVNAGTVYSAGAAKSAQNTTAEQYATNYLDKAAQYEDGELMNKDAMEASILESGLPSSEMKKLYTRYGIPLPSGE